MCTHLVFDSEYASRSLEAAENSISSMVVILVLSITSGKAGIDRVRLALPFRVVLWLPILK